MKKVLLAFGLTVGLAVSPALATEEITYQSFWGAAHQLNKDALETWCNGMEGATNGDIICHFNFLNTLVKTDAVASAVRNGSLEMGGIQIQTAVSMMPLSQLLSLPFLVQDAEEACALAPKLYEAFPEMREEAEKHFKILMYMGSDRFSFCSVKEPIKSPADMAGKRVLIWAPYQIEEVKAWGGIPVQVTSSETYMGLQRGLGEVAYVPFPAIESNKLSEVGKYITLIPSRSLPMVIAINWDVWNSLTENAQRYLEQTTGETMSLALGKGLIALSNVDMQKALDNGCTIYTLTLEEQAAFKDAAAEVNHAYWVDMLSRNGVKNPAEWIAKVEQFAAETFGRN